MGNGAKGHASGVIPRDYQVSGQGDEHWVSRLESEVRVR